MSTFWNANYLQENERLKALLQKTVESRGGFIPSGLDVTREVDQRLRNLEDFCQKISDREIDRYNFVRILNIGCGFIFFAAVATFNCLPL